MKKEPLISVIVPVYNVEEYLDQCIESIVNQTYKNLEIILVDDDSSDNCPKICDTWAKKDKRIKVIHKENGGVSSARNTGLDNAKGDYIGFIDSDDFIDKRMYEVLLDNLIKTNSDLSVCYLLKYFKNDKIDNYQQDEIKLATYTDISKYDNLFNERVVETTVVYTKLYKKEIFSQVQFPKGKINEDTATAYKFLNASSKIVYTNEKLYYYRQRENSIMSQKFNIKKLDGLEASHQQMLFFQKGKFKNTKYATLSLKVYMDTNLSYYCRIRNNNLNNQYQQQIKNLRQEYKKYYPEMMKKRISFKLKIKYFVCRHFPNLFYQITKKKFMYY